MGDYITLFLAHYALRVMSNKFLHVLHIGDENKEHDQKQQT